MADSSGDDATGAADQSAAAHAIESYAVRTEPNEDRLNLSMTPKQPPLFNGRISWFRYEDAVDEWVTLTSVEKPEKWGPLLRSRLIDDAAIYRNMLDPALLQDPVNGVEYFKKTLRPYFVKGSTNVFLYRLLTFFNCRRGNQEFIQFISKFEVNLMRLKNAWMDTFQEPVRTTANYYEKIGRANARIAMENNDKRQMFERDMTAARLSGALLPDEPQYQAQHDPESPQLIADWLHIQKDNHRLLFPFTENFIALFFIIQSDLSEAHRERLVSDLTLRGIQLQNYQYELLKSRYYDLFIVAPTGIQDPNIRKSTKGRTFWIVELGEFDGESGFWVEDDENHEEGFMPAEGEEEVFWCLDEHECYALRRVPGRRLKNRPRGYKGGKGRGKGRKRGGFRPYTGMNNKSGSKKANMAEEENPDHSYWTRKGKGKGKGKSKNKSWDNGFKGKDFGKTKDDKGKGKSKTFAASQPSQPSTEPAANVADGSWSGDQGQVEWYWDDESQAYWAWAPDASYQTFFVVDASQCATRDGLKLQPSAMASTSFETRLSKVLDVNKCPTHVILDNGCTRSMGSSFAVKRFVQAIKDSPYRGVSCWYEPVETTFTFANGQLGKSTHQLVISFDTKPPCKTTVDVLDQGRVPILFSIEQMRNLNMTISHTNVGDYITCKVFNLFQELLPISRSGHAMLDLASFVSKNQPSAYVDPGNEWSFQSSSVCAASVKTPLEPVIDRTDLDKEYIVGNSKQDHWIHIPGRHRLIRVHITQRRHLFVPQEKNCPISVKTLTNNRTTEATFENDESIVSNDTWRGKASEPFEKPWTGKTLFQIKTGGDSVDKVIPLSQNPNASSSNALPPESTSKEEIVDDIFDNPPTLPVALARIHARLAKKPELVKLHQKHYHMNMEQFKFRTKALHLPKNIFEQYQEVLDACETCQKNKNAPSRSRTSGLRSEVFGEMTFLDHSEVSIPGGSKIVMLVILDGATTLLTAHPVGSTNETESIKLFKEYLENYQLQPRYVVADRAFMTPAWEHVYQRLDIRPITLGPMTPWPNRAETANRLFKKQGNLMIGSLHDGTAHKSLTDITYRSLLKAAALARNSSITYGGVTPLELAFGRRPTDLIQLDTALPSQLTPEFSQEELSAQQLRDLSRKAYIEARQSDDIRRDLAGQFRMSTKTFQVGDRVFYWQEDKSKIKADGSRYGSWIRAKVISLQGSMVGIDLGTRILKVNISKLRRDDTISPSSPGIELEPPQLSRLNSKTTVNLADAFPEDCSEDGVPFTEALWNCVNRGKIHVLEIFAGSARLSQCCALYGMRVGTPIDIRNGFDLSTSKGRQMVSKIVKEQEPDVIILEPVCGPWSPMQNINDPETVREKQSQAMPMVEFTADMAQYQIKNGRYFIIENPLKSKMWYVRIIQNLLAQHGVTYGDLDMCAFGARDPVSHKLNLKPTSLLHNLPPNALMPIFKRCANRYLSKKHEHEQLEGNAKGFGSRTHLAQIYPWQFCKTLASCIAQMLRVRPHDQCTTLYLDLLDDFSDKECLTVSEAFHRDIDESLLPLSNITKVQMRKIADSPDVMCVQYKDIHKLTKTIKTIGNKVEIDLNTQDKESQIIQQLSHCCLNLRKRFLSSYVFEKCFIYRNTSGLSRPVAEKDTFAVVFAWSEISLQKLYLLPAEACDFTDFDASGWYFVVFAEGKTKATGKTPSFDDIQIPPDDHQPPIPPSTPDEPMEYTTVNPDDLVLPAPSHPPPSSGPRRLAGDSRAGPPNFSPIDEDDNEQIDVDDVDVGPPNEDKLNKPASPRPLAPTRPVGSPTKSIVTPSKKAKSKSPERVMPEKLKSSKNKTKKDQDEGDEEPANEPGQPSTLPIQSDSSPELIPEPPGDQSFEQLPAVQEEEEEESKAETDETIPYSNDESLFAFADDVHVDEGEWEQLPAALKIASNTGSFSYLQDELGIVPDSLLEDASCSRKFDRDDVLFSSRENSRQAFEVDLNAPGITDDDRAILTLYTKQHQVYAAQKTASLLQAKKRKEASKTEIQEYFQQFLEAKKLEIQSWLDNEVFELVDSRKISSKNWVTGRWVLTIKRDKEGKFLKCKARWVLRGFQDRQKNEQQTDSPAASRTGFRLAVQQAANKSWNLFHMDLKTAFLQGEAYDNTRDIICQVPPEMGYPPYIVALMKKPAYGLNDAPRRWWNVVDAATKKFGLVPTRADRCTYVYYGQHVNKTRQHQSKDSIQQDYESAVEYLLDPVAHNHAQGRTVHGTICLHVDDLFMAGDKVFEQTILPMIRKEFQVGSEDKNDIMFVGQRIRWFTHDKYGPYIDVAQTVAIEELSEIPLEKGLPDDRPCTPQQHTAYRSVLGQINWLQSRTQYHICYKFSRCASRAASPTIADIRAINKVVRTIRAHSLTMRFWPLKSPCRIVGFPDASYRNNEDKSSQRAHTIFMAEPRNKNKVSEYTRGSLVDYESHKITATTMSTTVAELHGLMRCFGSCQYIRGLWADVSGEIAEIHIRTDANNLVTTASTTHQPEQKETMHLIQMLRKESNSGQIHDLAHVRSEFCLADCLSTPVIISLVGIHRSYGHHTHRSYGHHIPQALRVHTLVSIRQL